jgi:hypothetical protein
MSDFVTPIRKSAYVEGIVRCNEVIMGYFEQDLKRRRNTYRPKLKETLEHKNAVSRLFKDVLKEAMEEAA